tara:strand:- start:1508 stop:2221 length:714 start_codon:yes stop_codon:yes gene_type:complete
MSVFADASPPPVNIIVPCLGNNGEHNNILQNLKQVESSIQLLQQAYKISDGRWSHPYYKRMLLGVADEQTFAVYETRELQLQSSATKYNDIWQSDETPPKNRMTKHGRRRARYRLELTYPLASPQKDFDLENIIHTINKPAKVGRFIIVNESEKQVFNTHTGGANGRFQTLRQTSTPTTSPSMFSVMCRMINRRMHFMLYPKNAPIELPLNVDLDTWKILGEAPGVLLFVQIRQLIF